MIKAEVRFTEKHFNVLMKTRKTSWVTYCCGFFMLAILAMLIVSNIYADGFGWDSVKPMIIWAVILMAILWLVPAVPASMFMKVLNQPRRKTDFSKLK